MYRMTRGQRIFNIFNIIVLLGVLFVTVYPMLYILFASFSVPSRIIKHTGLLLWPLGFSLDAYEFVMNYPAILRGYVNTGVLVLGGTAINLLLTVFCAYALSRPYLYIRKAVTVAIIFTMFFSGGLIPLYLVVRGMNLFNNLLSLILPFAISSFNMIIMRTYFEGIPASLDESARIDGANDIVILFRVYLPLALPSLAVIGLYYAVAHWNAWFYAMCFITDRAKFPLQLLLRQILILNLTSDINTGMSNLGEVDISESIKYASIIITTLPILLVYPFLQKYFVKGMTLGAVKG